MSTIKYSFDIISANGTVLPIPMPEIPGNPIAVRHSLFKTIETAFAGAVTPEIRAMLKKEGSTFGVSYWTDSNKGNAIFGYTGIVSGTVIIDNKKNELEIYRLNMWEVETEEVYSITSREKIEVIKDIQALIGL